MSHLARLQLTRRLPCTTTTTTQRLNSGQTSNTNNKNNNTTNSSSKQLINTSYVKTLTRELSFNAPHLNQTQPKTDYRKSLKPYELNIS